MQNRAEKTKSFTSRMQAKLLLVFCVVALLLAGLIGRLIYIMQTDGERYAKQVLSRQSYVRGVLPYKRGEILDRNGTVLARSELRYRLILDPQNLLYNSDKIPTTLEALKKYYNIEAETINNILKERPDSRYKILLENLQLSQVEDFKKLMEEDSNIKSLWFEEIYVRAYPYDSLACDIIGFTSPDNKGLWGIEEYYNDELSGTNGREYGYYDSSLNIERIIKKPQHGHTVVSTIDVNAQRIIQKHIRAFNEEIGSKNIGVIVMNANNGEILAMASNEEYNLNSPRDLSSIISEDELSAMTLEEKIEAMNRIWKNDVISSGFEPGSTFKPFTVAIGLEEGIISKNSSYLCDGVEHVGGWDIKCSAKYGHGELTLTETLVKSCNDAMMQIAAAEGRDNFYKYQKYFSFGEKTGIDLPGEESGIITELERLNASELATSSFGQSFNVSMIQMAAAYSSLVNGGYYYQPRIVKEIMNDQNATVKIMEPLLVRRTVSDETSQFIREAMLQTVEVGTAKPARVTGYAIGGKTGTAEKLPRGEKKYLVSFLGAVPALNPEIVIYVIIDEPQNVVRQDDSSLATGLASRIMKELLPALGIYPDGEIDYLLPDTDEENTQDTNDDNPDVQQPQQSEDEQDISTEDQNQTEQNQTEEQTEEPRTENPDEQETEEPHFLNDE
ncbi:MAG: peptidoglycan glycosyltransferase [Clostridiales bacterium]|jgi:stage V sporulation protein D (sporulation-specific penicillin-binding protein)|nr:peptidoglycan glycosyltransferase [Clostridiales bacterium]